MNIERKTFDMSPLKSTIMGPGRSKEYPESMNRFRVPFDWEKQLNQVGENASSSEIPLLLAENEALRRQNSILQGEIGTLRIGMQTMEERISELERARTEKETESPQKRVDRTYINKGGKQALRQDFRQMLKPQNKEAQIQKELASENVRVATQRLEKVNNEKEERLKKEEAVAPQTPPKTKIATQETAADKKPEATPVSLLEKAAKPSNEARKKEETAEDLEVKKADEEKRIEEMIDKKVAEKVKAIEEAAEKRIAAIKADAEKTKAKEIAEARTKALEVGRQRGIIEGKEMGKKEGKDELIKEFNRKRGWIENIKNIFRRHPKTEEDKEKADKMRADILRVGVLGGIAVGAAVTFATWAIMQGLGYFLPFKVPAGKVLVDGVQKFPK